MKNVRLIVLATITMLFMGMANIHAQENGSKTVIIRALEAYSGTKPFLVTTDAEGKSSRIELEKAPDESGHNAALIQKELNKWKQEGYKITQLSISNGSYMHTTIILEK